MQVEDQFGIGLRQPEQRRAFARHGGFAVMQQRQVLIMELQQKIARGLRRGQIVSEQQRQGLVLAKLIEVFGALAAGRPHRQQTLHHFRRAQPALADLQAHRAINHRRRAGLTKRLDQTGNPGIPRQQSAFQLRIDLKIQPLRHQLPPAPRG